MTTGEKIKKRRKELHMSAEQLGNILGKDRSTIYRYESGGIENMPTDILLPIADALRTTPGYLMGWDEDAITAAEQQQSEAQNISDMLEYENMDLYNDLFDLMLTRQELMDVLQYANFVKSRRKES